MPKKTPSKKLRKLPKTCMWNTNIPEVTEERTQEALKEFKSLRRSIDDLEEAFKRRKPRDPVAIGWVENIMGPLMKIFNEVGRINGAVLVYGTETSEVE